uniref:Uncharacterized protein n=1 Tax=Arundo donax TaxID=35708 RepID=A0A0A9BND9_ARUDO
MHFFQIRNIDQREITQCD